MAGPVEPLGIMGYELGFTGTKNGVDNRVV